MSVNEFRVLVAKLAKKYLDAPDRVPTAIHLYYSDEAILISNDVVTRMEA